jgi:dihydrofolate synthase/folylpolyglutamate synthase
MLFDEALRYLLSLGHETISIKLGLENIERLLIALHNPQTSFQSVQIAGTNGKGSTAAMLYEIALTAGLSTGLYTSPHLERITERIRINGQEISGDEFARLATIVREASERLLREEKLAALPTFFEQVTAIALLAFREAGVRLAILETGLGGRLDATTAARAEVVAITPVSLDHQEYLGETLAEIAAEKAAIIRPGAVAVIAPQPAEVMEVIKRRCIETKVTPLLSGSAEVVGATPTGNFIVRVKTVEDLYGDVRLGLRGRHQAVNAGVAIRLAETLRPRGFHISRDAIIEGIRRTEYAGRLELMEGAPSVLFDGAHNQAGAAALHGYLKEFVKSPVTLIFGAMRDKELGKIAELLFPDARRLILTEMENPRAADHSMLRRVVPPGFDSERLALAATPREALRLALELTPHDGIIVITGSLYFVGEIRALLRR